MSSTLAQLRREGGAEAVRAAIVAALELVAPDAMIVARERDARDAARLAALAVARVALADALASHAALAALLENA